ncbi:MAG: hypothetical protein KAX38_03485, partial [Candidatus Krumholzibacteria bacterium]|nr:hypothetical protein [Candidatus Krumholzibacteria bacterium]
MGSSGGDNDGIIENGEVIEMGIIIKNIGVETATGTRATLTCLDPFVSIIDSTCYIGNITPRSYIIKNGAFIFELDSRTPDGHSIDLELEFSSQEGQWNTHHALAVNAPGIVLESWSVTDTLNGNGNGCLEAWECHNINCTWRNNGSIDVISPDLRLSFPDGSPARTIKNKASASSIPVGGCITFDFAYFVRGFTPPFTKLDSQKFILSYLLTVETRISDKQVYIPISCLNSATAPTDSPPRTNHSLRLPV